MNKLSHSLWGLAERADWYSWPPKRFWRWLLRYYDRKSGVLKASKAKLPDVMTDSQNMQEPPR